MNIIDTNQDERWESIEHFDSAQEWLTCEVIKFCACGFFSEKISELLLSTLKDVAKSKTYTQEPRLEYELALQILERAELIDHGSSIYGAFLTDDGKHVCHLLNILFDS